MSDEPKADLASVAREVHSIKGMVVGLHGRQDKADEGMKVLREQHAGLVRQHMDLDRRVDGVSHHISTMDRLQAQRDQRNDEIHQDLRQEMGSLRSFMHSAISRLETWQTDFRKDFAAHTAEEDKDRKETIKRLRSNTSAILLAGVPIGLGVLSIIVTLLVKAGGG